MTIKERIDTFAKLGSHLKNLSAEEIEQLQLRAASENPWFTADNVKASIEGIAKFLDASVLSDWVAQYDVKDQQKTIGVVMAGNIPLVGFHDLLCVIISGNKLKPKLSSKDSSLMHYVIDKLIAINPAMSDYIHIADQLKGIDGIIATGSDNSSRYFEYYFSKYPHIIRKNRTSCAILDNESSESDLEALGNDIFKYFGLGCRNVSKLYVPENYDFTKFFESIEGFNEVKHHHKYANNYDYNKSIYLVNKDHHLDNGFLILKPDSALVSPISVLFYKEYKNGQELKESLTEQKDKIQCIVSKDGVWPGSKPFGKAQLPEVDDYADGVDTMKFLTAL
ncbi:acyl-CoA reductase [Fulvivirga sp. RKSG066]|uniref:acyl-CoA reductase n=1 Tax=Fulvivirga aurantia TaxID=2529383 RepID=UPI0012BCAAFC|nr:acyl-CoA reductase [Fulvivirga aurantia]MTI19931.1 acyl-CoA reductase [Fulvivirga aurantia]